MDSLAGKLAVVTGGGSGMGRELVRQLAAQGWAVTACDVAEEAQVLRFRDVVLVMPGHVPTDIVANSLTAFGVPEADARAASTRAYPDDACDYAKLAEAASAADERDPSAASDKADRLSGDN